jgi:L-fuconolactonase
MTDSMDAVDAQIHMGPGGIDEVLAAMNALGIAGALVDEYWLASFDNRPHVALPGGLQRPVGPTAELAALLHPDRFSFLLRIGRLDPDYEAVIRHVRDTPGGRALRIDPGLSPFELMQFAQGGYDHILKAAADAGLPLFVFGPDSPEAFARAAGEFPGLRIAVDHCGVYSNSMRTGFAERDPLDAAGQLALFDRILALSEFPNVALKWGHASAMFNLPAWPGDALSPILRKAVSAFGAERVMWASDYSVNQRGESWADLLYGVKSDPGLSEADKAKVLGGALRAWIRWSA